MGEAGPIMEAPPWRMAAASTIWPRMGEGGTPRRRARRGQRPVGSGLWGGTEVGLEGGVVVAAASVGVGVGVGGGAGGCEAKAGAEAGVGAGVAEVSPAVALLSGRGEDVAW